VKTGKLKITGQIYRILHELSSNINIYETSLEKVI